jgi:hypothetical protein
MVRKSTRQQSEYDVYFIVLEKYSLFWDVTHRILVVTDVSVQPIGPIFKGRAIHCSSTLEDGTDRFYRNVGNYQSTLRNIP